ncbi:hypothetical protein B0E53_06612 [Micromonospora sp. MH33]|nr:hypothetical protein B0E53_06612 [Micromonospora sp. MH33]
MINKGGGVGEVVEEAGGVGGDQAEPVLGGFAGAAGCGLGGPDARRGGGCRGEAVGSSSTTETLRRFTVPFAAAFTQSHSSRDEVRPKWRVTGAYSTWPGTARIRSLPASRYASAGMATSKPLTSVKCPLVMPLMSSLKWYAR